MRLPFTDRYDAGSHLGAALCDYVGRGDVVMMAIPPGGVPVAARAAEFLGVQLDLMLVQEMHLPGREELTVGALAAHGGMVLNVEILEEFKFTGGDIESLVAKERRRLRKWERACRNGCPAADVRNRCVILVDDGLEAGVTLEAALMDIRERQPSRIVLAAPVAQPETLDLIREQVDDVVCLAIVNASVRLGTWYETTECLDDVEVSNLLKSGRARYLAYPSSGKHDPPSES